GWFLKERQTAVELIFAVPPASSGPGWRQRSGTGRWPRQWPAAASGAPQRKLYLRRNTGDGGGLRRIARSAVPPSRRGGRKSGGRLPLACSTHRSTSTTP